MNKGKRKEQLMALFEQGFQNDEVAGLVSKITDYLVELEERLNNVEILIASSMGKNHPLVEAIRKELQEKNQKEGDSADTRPG